MPVQAGELGYKGSFVFLSVGVIAHVLKYLTNAEVTPAYKWRHSTATDPAFCWLGDVTLVVFSSVLNKRV